MSWVSVRTQAHTDSVRKLQVYPRSAMAYAPKGVSASQLGGLAGQSLLKLPTGAGAFGQLDPTMGESMRKVRGDLRRCALPPRIERPAVGRPMLRWQEFNASFAPISQKALAFAPRGGRPVGNTIGRPPRTPTLPRRSALRQIRRRRGGESRDRRTRRISGRIQGTRNRAPSERR